MGKKPSRTERAGVDAQWEVMRQFLHGVLTQLRAELALRLRRHTLRGSTVPLPCQTCAFQAGTDHWKGFDSTTCNFIAALATGQRFFCHQGMARVHGEYAPPRHWVDGRFLVDEAKLTPCAAWSRLTEAPAIKIGEYVPAPLQAIIVAVATGKK